ncbi:protein phosphatase 1 regulatory subunit 26 [Sorex fumeus]|uniref:protein phosphatase 1 regulatory subunit 26 n=1 Tax=Sorex fumeus TaxID=62283 RepID=UPI0024AE456C|nr:protein phosphatase 1 regulatory subunit 26 [Sorex fumeus]
MFLMNAPPVLALQSRWEAFRPPGGCRAPGCFSGPAGSVGDAAVSAGVQMLIRTLRRGDPAALGASPERGPQRRQGPERPAPPAPLPRNSVSSAPASADPHLAGEGATDPGPPVPDSDSDDSVDRGIEEAIQEYLRARSSGPRPPRATHADLRCPQQPPRAASCPPRPARYPSGGPQRACEPLGSASPGSGSSEDSFEQSIRDEIEQFLSEKRLLEAPGAAGCVDRQEESEELAARPAPRARKEPELTAAAKEFVFRKPPRFAKVPAPPRSLRSKATPEPGLGGTRPTTCRSAEPAQPKGGVRRASGPGRRSRRGPSAVVVQEAPDSSSDDGIEEAIRLYQLEKRRGTMPESHRKAAASIRRPPAGKAADPGPIAPDPSPPARPPADPSRGEAGGRGPCPADASTELLCAEAILDISKTILPTPTEGRERALAAGLPGSPPHVPSGSDGAGSSVDSDDSIEQEIRTFLALKAQAGVAPAAVETSPAPVQGPPGQAGSLRAPLPRTLALSLSHKRRRRAGGHVPALATPREMPLEGTQEASAQQGRVSETPAREGESRAHAPLPRTGGLGGELEAPDAPPSVSLGSARAEEKESSDDKSSSLDSDEDLDTAIKDLLRSKRKRRKGCGDPRAAPPLKVRLSTAPKVLYQLEGLQRAWRHKGPALWRRCFPKPRGSRGMSREPTPSSAPRRSPGEEVDAEGGPPGLLTRRSPEATLFSGPQELRHPAPSPSSASEEDSSSVDSDDSIELEIRKFLAEKAKESLGGPSTPGTGGSPRPEPLCRKALPAGMCTRSQRGRGAASPASTFAQAGRSSPRMEPAQRDLAPPRGTKGSPGGRRPFFAHRDQSPRVAEPAAGDGTLGTLAGCVVAAIPAESPSARCPGLSPLRPLSRGLAVDRDVGAPAGLALPWADFAQQSRLQSLWALSPEGGGGAWQGAEGQARCPPGPALDAKKGLALAGFSPLLPTQLFHFGRSVSWGGQPAGLFSSPLGVPLQGPSFSGFQGAQAAQGPVFGSSHVLLKRDGGCWPPGRAPAGRGGHDARRRGAEGGTVDSRRGGRPAAREEDEQETLGSGASDLSDSSMEEGTRSPLARGKVLEL